MQELTAGVAVVDITPAPGLLLAGFAARTEPALGHHDPLTVRAVSVGNTAIVVADVIGIHEEMSARIRARCPLPDANVIVAATHTHGAPNSMTGRLGNDPDTAFLVALEDGCVAAIAQALANAVPARLGVGMGENPDVARNRRHADGPTDPALPVLRIRDVDGRLLALIVSHALHPTVLGADNRLMTAEYPHFLRARIEAAHPGVVAIFLNGCTGDVNIGHSAQASVSLAANAARSFANAQRVGERIADVALAAPELPMGNSVSARYVLVDLALERRETDLSALVAAWQAEAQSADPVRAAVLAHWVHWARRNADIALDHWTGRVSLLDWGGVPIVAMPGEIFSETSLAVRAVLGGRPAFVLSYADATPGYIPPASEFPFGGYEVDEAHRFIGMPGSFAPGSAERLVKGFHELARPIVQIGQPWRAEI